MKAGPTRMQKADAHERWPAMFGIMVALVGCTAFIGRAYLLSPSVQSQSLAEPAIIDPGPVGGPPSDAIALFDGRDLSHWNSVKGGEAKWLAKDGVMTVVPHSGNIATKQEFGDMQLHLEWATPAEVIGEGQGRGNSGVFLMGQYEVQILDSFGNKTYFDGQAGSIYKQYAPLVNPSRGPAAAALPTATNIRMKRYWCCWPVAAAATGNRADTSAIRPARRSLTSTCRCSTAWACVQRPSATAPANLANLMGCEDCSL